jgi:hypothetical protein
MESVHINDSIENIVAQLLWILQDAGSHNLVTFDMSYQTILFISFRVQ